MAQVPETTTSLLLPAFNQPLDIDKSPTAPAGHGTALVQVLATNIRPYLRQSFAGKGFFTFPFPYAAGNSAIGRVLSTGADAVALQPGQLVFVDGFVRSRDDPEGTQIMLGMHDGNAERPKKLFDAWKGLWRDVAAVPIENCMPLDEKTLTGMGYSFGEMLYIERLAVASGGVSAANLRPGDTVIITPASGQYSGAMVELAAQSGCRVLALTRSAAKIEPLTSRHPRVTPIVLTGDADVDTAAIRAACPNPLGADALIEISPFEATFSPGHLTTALAALRPAAHAVLLGAMGDVPLNLMSLMMRNITVKGQWMYSRAQLASLIRAVEAGVVKLGRDAGHEVVDGGWKLEDWEKALEVSEGVTQWGRQTMFTPYA